MKKYNRQVELMLHDLEYLCTLAAITGTAKGYAYPHEKLAEVWEPFMLGQFHDCLPGSSIRKVYEDMERTYVQLFAKMNAMREEAVVALSLQANGSNSEQGSLLAALNTLGIARQEVVELDTASDSALLETAGALQHLKDGRTLIMLEDTMGTGLLKAPSTVSAEAYSGVSARQDGQAFLLESADIRVRIEDGRISSIYDKVDDREILAYGQTAGFSISQDYPPEFDNWEVEVYSLDTVEQLSFHSVSVTDNGPYRASLTATVHISSGSSISAEIFLDALPLIPSLSSGDRPRTAIQFRTSVNWHESHRFLRVQVPTSIRAEAASYEMQFGHVTRATTRNTTWEAAKFEVCGHKFADLSEPNFGLSILTQSKYGYSVEGSLMRLSLLKAGAYPDSKMDRGQHVVDFALYPHSGSLMDGNVIDVARVYNAKPVLKGLLRELVGNVSGLESPFRVLQDSTARYSNVVLDTIKMAEPPLNGESETGTTVICRLYEAYGTRTKVTLQCDLAVQSVSITNLMEEENTEESTKLREAGALSSDGKLRAVLQFRPFEFKTVRIELR